MICMDANHIDFGIGINRENQKPYLLPFVKQVQTYFDAIGVPRTTDGTFKDGSPAPFSSDGMVTFARAIRVEKMNSHTDDLKMLTGNTPYTVSYMFEHVNDFRIGKRNSTDK
jgi:NAD(P)H dehydrogenase (quinone)